MDEIDRRVIADLIKYASYICFMFIFMYIGIQFIMAIQDVDYVHEDTFYINEMIKRNTVETFFGSFDTIKRIEIDSVGGDYDAAASIANYLVDHPDDITVSVGNRCYSACLAIFAASQKREVKTNSKFMFHFVFRYLEDSKAIYLSKTTKKYLQQLNNDLKYNIMNDYKSYIQSSAKEKENLLPIIDFLDEEQDFSFPLEYNMRELAFYFDASYLEQKQVNMKRNVE